MLEMSIQMKGSLEEMAPYVEWLQDFCRSALNRRAEGDIDPPDVVVRPSAPDTREDELGEFDELERSYVDWTMDEFRPYWQRISVNARKFLQELAQRPEGYHAAELKKKTNLDTKNLGGACNSADNQWTKTPGRKPKVYGRNGWVNNGYIYTMPVHVAELIKRPEFADLTRQLDRF